MGYISKLLQTLYKIQKLFQQGSAKLENQPYKNAGNLQLTQKLENKDPFLQKLLH